MSELCFLISATRQLFDKIEAVYRIDGETTHIATQVAPLDVILVDAPLPEQHIRTRDLLWFNDWLAQLITQECHSCRYAIAWTANKVIWALETCFGLTTGSLT